MPVKGRVGVGFHNILNLAIKCLICYLLVGQVFLYRFVQLSYAMGSQMYKVELSEVDDPDDQVMKVSGLGIGFGYSILVNNNISIETIQ